MARSKMTRSSKDARRRNNIKFAIAGIIVNLNKLVKLQDSGEARIITSEEYDHITTAINKLNGAINNWHESSMELDFHKPQVR